MGTILILGRNFVSLKTLDITQIGYLARGETETGEVPTVSEGKFCMGESFHPKRRNIFSN